LPTSFVECTSHINWQNHYQCLALQEEHSPGSMPNKLTDNASRLKAIIDTAVDGIITIDARGTIETINPAVTKLFGYVTEELLGNNIKMLMPEPDKSRHDQYLEKYNHTGRGSIIGKGREVVGRRKDGTTFPFLLSISELELSDKKIFTGIIHDISELAEVKDALRKEMQLNELKSRFVTMASHEFRTPLSAILSSASLIGKYNDTEDEEKRKKHVTRIKSSVANLTNILNDFLSISRLEEGKVLNTPVEFDVKELAQEVIEEISSVLKDRQTIDYEHKGLGKDVLLDKNIIKNIAINLLSNAIKYSQEGKEILFLTHLTENQLVIKIKDQGIGIPEEDQVHLFNRFFRAQNVTSIQGTGLGLNIVKKYVDLLNGQVEFSSELNVGTTFTILLPLQN
jgi:two-component system, LuxR family, sensor kinase FixL